MRSIAHIRKDDGVIETVEEHLLEVQALSEEYGEKIGVKHIAGLAGLLHDLGKYTKEFANYIQKAVYDPENAPKRGSVDHSTAGGKFLFDLLHNDENSLHEKLLAEIVGNVIISHHAYLHDYIRPAKMDSPYLTRVFKKELPEYGRIKKCFFNKVISEKDLQVYLAKAVAELKVYIKKSSKRNIEFKIMFLTKFVFSCLIDADRTSTRIFMENKLVKKKPRFSQVIYEEYYERLNKTLKTFEENESANNKINILRREMSEQCDQFADNVSNVYTLSIPTGGGKTLASFRYALKHALKHEKERIIYIVPYTTIIEQNAQAIRDIIEDDEHLLEHHSNVIVKNTEEEDIYTKEINEKLMLAKDNWDAPIIFTTMVQFLNVFYARDSRSIRRLHNLSKAVLIFDEVQKVPVRSISLFNQAVNFLKRICQSSVVLCTATQPALQYVNHSLDFDAETSEIIKDIDEVSKHFKRIDIIDKASNEKFNNEKLLHFSLKQLEEKNNVLIILNTKSVVRNFYNLLKEQSPKDTSIYHLSTSMCAAHRSDIFAKVIDDLNQERRVLCVSTQLIEAGVDISFNCVIRSLAGLDSIAQAAGRCNRHGERRIRQVYVIDHEEEYLSKLPEIRQGKEITRKMLIDLKRDPSSHGGDLLSGKAMMFYFKNLYQKLKTDLNYPLPSLDTNIVSLLGRSDKGEKYKLEFYHREGEEYPLLLLYNSYRTAAENFKAIEDYRTGVIVPYGKGEEYIAKFNSFESLGDLSILLKKSQQYSVNLSDQELAVLKQNGKLVSLRDGLVLALVEGSYDLDYGVNIQGDSSLAFNIF